MRFTILLWRKRSLCPTTYWNYVSTSEMERAVGLTTLLLVLVLITTLGCLRCFNTHTRGSPVSGSTTFQLNSKLRNNPIIEHFKTFKCSTHGYEDLSIRKVNSNKK